MIQSTPVQIFVLKVNHFLHCLFTTDNTSSMLWLCFQLNRASSAPEAGSECDFCCGRCCCAVLPGRRLHASQLDLASGGSYHPGPHRKSEAAVRLVPADQWGADSGCRGVPLCGHQRPRRQQYHRVASRPRYVRTIPCRPYA